MSGLKMMVGKVKNADKEWYGYRGLTLLLTRFNDDDKLFINGPFTLDEMEKYYRQSYEECFKDDISDDFDYCIWYVMSENCEYTSCIDKVYLENIREATEADLKLYEETSKQFNEIHKVKETQRRIDKEKEEDKLALEEFNKTEKVKFAPRLKDGNFEVDAVIYKGFAIHDEVLYEPGQVYKAISVTEGDYKGYKMTSCRVAKYKSLIDEIRAIIGDRPIESEDSEKMVEILKKY